MRSNRQVVQVETCADIFSMIKSHGSLHSHTMQTPTD